MSVFCLSQSDCPLDPNFINYPYRDEMIGDAIEKLFDVCKQTLTPKSQRTHSHILHKLLTLPFFEESKRRKNQDKIKYKLMEAADAKGELASMLDPEKASKDPYADYLKLTENDILEHRSQKEEASKT